MSRRKRIGVVAGIAVVGLATGVAFAGGAGPSASGSRLDDGKDLLPQAKITEQEAIRAAQAGGSDALNEVDLERADGRLVFNVDVGDRDVKVDATTGEVVGSTSDD
jgi:uncharacterized membrane protein YkoI